VLDVRRGDSGRARTPDGWRPSRPLVLAFIFGLAFALPAGTFAARPAAIMQDITASGEGSTLAHAAADRMNSRYGVRTDAASLTVWELGEHRIAGPKGSKLTATEVIGADGERSLRVSTSEPAGRTVAAHSARVATEGLAAAALGWQMVGSWCWTDMADRDISYMDVCYHKWKATADGSPKYDYYALDMFSTFATPEPLLETGDPWIKAWPTSASPAATWHDWKPRSDATGCSSNVNLSTSVNGFGLSLSGNRCETGDITKGGPAGTFTNAWREGLCQMENGERELEFTVAVRVAQGKVPRWSFDWLEHVQVASCVL
jgi:hypothetical protein